MAITTKQQVFIEEYLKCWNATEAARVAGYAYPTREGWRLLHERPFVEEAIKERLAEKAMTADEVLARLADRARVSLADFVTVEDDGSWHVDLVKAREAEKLDLIDRLYVDRNGNVRLEIASREKALELLAKYHGLFSDAANVNVGVQVGPQIILDDGSD